LRARRVWARPTQHCATSARELRSTGGDAEPHARKHALRGDVQCAAPGVDGVGNAVDAIDGDDGVGRLGGHRGAGGPSRYVHEQGHLPVAAAVSMAWPNAVASDILNSDPDNLSFGYERLRAMRVGAIHGSRGA
jgi:hypothetical protein